MASSAASVDGSSPVSLLVPSPIDRSDRARIEGRRSKRRFAADRNIPAVRPFGGRVTQTHVLRDLSEEPHLQSPKVMTRLYVPYAITLKHH